MNMDTQLTLMAVIISIVAGVSVVLLLAWKRIRVDELPPGPPSWPIVGNLFQVGWKMQPHESLLALSQKYGPLMTLSLGVKTTVVVSSAEMAKEVLKTHDHIFAGRTVIEAVKSVSYHKSSIAWAEYGARWRKLRRISNTQLMTHMRLQALQHLRRDEVFRTTKMIFEMIKAGKSCVNIGHTVFYTGMNLIGNMIFSTTVYDPNNPDSVTFKDNFKALLHISAKPNLADSFPALGFLDLQGVSKKMGKYFTPINGFLDGLIQDRLAARSKGLGHQREADRDFLDVLLDLKDDDLTLQNIRTLIFEFFMAGSDTTATAIEWGMAEFLKNPEKMKRAQAELEEVVGCKRRVEESDIPKLAYLHAAVKEVLRLHPSVPLLIPHRAESSCKVAGFTIPKHTSVIMNVWAIARDPRVWKEPSKFLPERFLEGELNSTIDYKGQNFELLPFGSGRRICMGIPLADRMLHLVLASLLHSFDWSLPDGMQLEMNSSFGMVLRKAVDLRAIPSPRLPNHIY